MRSTQVTRATGIQVAFLIFAVVFLSYPAQKFLGPLLGLDPADRPTGRLLLFASAIALLLSIPGLRRYCVDALGTPILPQRRPELVAVASLKVLMPFAIYGAVVLWFWLVGGEMGLARRLGHQRSIEDEMSRALSTQGIVMGLFMAALVAPIVEELVFRGLLYRAWEAQWGWFWSMIATSMVFAAYHPNPFGAFVGSILFVAVLRRTGSLWGPIIVHGIGNAAVWPPLMGQFYFRTAGKETGEIGLWWLHLAALAVLLIALPIYVWMSRDRGAAGAGEDLGEDAAAARC